jgi:hypothetical protein
MGSERKMKLTNLAKSVLAASALSIASFGASAGAIATADLTIDNLLFQFDTLGAAPGSPTSGFSGSEATASVNNVGGQDAWSTGGLPLNLTYSVGSGIDTSGTGAYGVVDLSGDLTTTGSTGITNSSASAYGVKSALGTATVQNIVSATFTGVFDTDVMLTVSFDWLIDLYSDITTQFAGQTATSSYDFELEIEGSDDFWDIDLRDLVAQGSNKRTQQSMGTNTLNSSGSYTNENAKFSLDSGERYTFTITQATRSDVVSVAEPTSVAILGLSLLGLAGVSRRRKS